MMNLLSPEHNQTRAKRIAKCVPLCTYRYLQRKVYPFPSKDEHPRLAITSSPFFSLALSSIPGIQKKSSISTHTTHPLKCYLAAKQLTIHPITGTKNFRKGVTNHEAGTHLSHISTTYRETDGFILQNKSLVKAQTFFKSKNPTIQDQSVGNVFYIAQVNFLFVNESDTYKYKNEDTSWPL